MSHQSRSLISDEQQVDSSGSVTGSQESIDSNDELEIGLEYTSGQSVNEGEDNDENGGGC